MSVCLDIKSRMNDTEDLFYKLTNRSMFAEIIPTFMEGRRYQSCENNVMFNIGSYIAKRAYLTEALISCGLEHGCKRAKELAIEHILDIIYLHIMIGALFKKLGWCLLVDLGRWREAEEMIYVIEQFHAEDVTQRDFMIRRIVRSEEDNSFLEFIMAVLRLKWFR